MGGGVQILPAVGALSTEIGKKFEQQSSVVAFFLLLSVSPSCGAPILSLSKRLGTSSSSWTCIPKNAGFPAGSGESLGEMAAPESTTPKSILRRDASSSAPTAAEGVSRKRVTFEVSRCRASQQERTGRPWSRFSKSGKSCQARPRALCTYSGCNC